MQFDFNPEQLLDVSTDSATSTKRIPVPEGIYQCLLGEPKIRTWSSEAKGTSGVVLDVPLEILDEGVKVQLGRDKIVVTAGVMLDMNAAGNALDMGPGKNTRLGKLREAAGQNTPGKAWSPRMLQGAMVQAMIVHRADKDGDPIEDVKSFAKL